MVVDAGIVPDESVSSKSPPAAASRRAAIGRIARQGPGRRNSRSRRFTSTAAPIRKPIRCRRRGTRSSSCATIAHLRPRTNTFGAIARVRNASADAIHDSSRSRAFSTSTRRSSRPATAKAPARCSASRRSTSTSCRNDEGKVDYAQDFFGKPAYLTVSGQLEGEIFACALGKVYTFGPTFRAENSNTSRHLAEFWMVEPEMAFYDLDDNMDLAEAFLKRIIARRARPLPRGHGVLRRAHRQDGARDAGSMSSTADFVRLPYTEAVDILKKSGKTFEFPVEWGNDLQAEHERYLTEKHFKKPVILYDYPRTLKAVLHARQRRRQNGAGDGRARARRRRDHRRQPARGAARRARSSG